MAKDDGNTKSKKKDASSVSLSGSADASGLRRSNREIPSRKQATASPSASARRSERIEHQTTPSSSPIKKKPDKIEEQMGPSSLRRSDRSKKQLSPSGSKKLVEVPASSNIESKKEKIASNPKEDAGDVSVEKKIDNKIERQDPDDGGRKRKRMTVRGYKALFKPQILRIEAEDGQDSDVQHTPTESGNGDKQISGKCSQDNNGKISPIESGNGEKQIPGKCSQDNNGKMSPIENGNEEKQICGKCSQDNNGKMSTQNMDIHSCSKEQSINGDLKNQQELETRDKILHETPTFEVRNTCQESTVMENTESNDAKFVEFWVPVQISNVQLEQYCSTLLSGAMALRSCSKSDSFGALHNILLSNRKCCDHPYLVDKDIQTLITKDQPQNIHFDLGYKSSGKVHFLDLILPEVRKRKLRVVILFQPSVATGSGTSTSIGVGDILDDFVNQRFGADSYERVDGGARMRMEYKQAALNNFNEDKNKFILLLERHAFQPSIKLSSVDIIIIFDSSLNPANDTKALQKMSINSNSEQIMIFRLYSKNTLEEQIVKLAEQNVPLDSKLQNLSRITCDALLMWGVKDLFQKLDTFHGKSGNDISSEERFLKDVKEEFLYIISDKYKSKDREKSMITKVQSCGYNGNKNMPYGEIKTQLSDGEQPHVFWRNLLEGKYPRWKFVPVSTSRQRKRPQYYGDTPDTIAPVADVVKRRKKSPASKPVIQKETGGANEGAHNESQSSSGGHFWSITVPTEKSLSDLLKPTVNDLCKILKFPVDVTNTVENFLDYVIENYNVSSKDHESTLQAFMISLCWIGASLAKHKIGRSESFDLAKKDLNFNCKEEEANSVYLKLEEAKESFLKQTENQEKHDALEDSKSPPQAVCTESTEQKMSQESQHDQNVEKSESLETVEKQRDEIEKSKREWDEKRVNLENDCELEKRMIRALYKNPSTRSEKLKSLDKELANKLEEHERNKDIHLKELKATLLTAEVAADMAVDNELPLCGSGDSKQGVGSCDKPETSVTVGNPEGEGDKMTEMPMELDGGTVQDQSKERGSLGLGDEIESTCSHTSEKQMVDATVESSLPFVEIPPHQRDTADDDVAGVLNGETPGKQCDEIENNVAENAATVELRMPEVDSNQENGEDETINSDHGETPGKQCDEIENNVAENAATVELGMPEIDSNQENSEDETINSEKSLAGEEQNDSCGSSSSNQPSAGDTPSVQPIASQAPDDQMPTILESENESLLEQLLDLGIQEKEGEADPDLLAQINSEEPHDDPMAENESDTHPANELLPETTHENDANTPGTVNDQQSVEQHNSTQNSEPPETTNQNTSQPETNMFDLPNQVLTRIPNHGDPLQAEMERLFAYKDNVAKFYADMKRRLKSDCEKEIAEMIAQINLKYEAKYKEAETAFELKKKELDTTVNRVVMNKILAEAFRAKCQDLNPSGPRMQKVSLSQAGLMQELHRFSVRPSIDVASSSPGQSSGRQQTPPPPPLPQSPPQPPPPQPPLQIVHQPAALFSSTVSRPPTNTNLRPPSTTPIRPPPTINPVTPTSRPPPNITPNTRPPPTITPVTPTTRPPPNITPLTPSAGNLRAPAPHLRPLVNSDVRASAPLTSSAGSLRAPAPHLRPLVNSDVRAPAPHMRPLVSGEIRAPAPHIRPFKPSTSASPELTPVHRRLLPGQHVTSLPNSQPPLPKPSIPPLPPLPPEASYVPPPPPPPSPPPSASSWQPSRSQSPQPPRSPKSTAPPPQHHQLPPLPRIPQIPTSQTGPSSTFPRPESGGAGYDLLDLTDIFPEDNARPSSGHDLVCLSDDD